MEKVYFNWKWKTFLLIFAPFTQLTFLGVYIYFWTSQESEKNEVWTVNQCFEATTMVPFFVENVPFPLEAGEDAERSGRKHLLCRLHDLVVSHRRPRRSMVG